MKILSLAASAAVISACFATTPVAAQQRGIEPPFPVARGQSQSVVVGIYEQRASGANARRLRHRFEERAARLVATEPVGSWPPGVGDRPRAQWLHGAAITKVKSLRGGEGPHPSSGR
jgi:hypothetical protein